MVTLRTYSFWLTALLVVGFLLRLLAVASADTSLAAMRGGDSIWYLANGSVLASGATQGQVFGVPVDISTLPSAPLYPLFIGLLVNALPLSAAILAIRVLQSLLSIAVVYFAAQMGRRISGEERVGLLIAGALTFSLALIIEPVNIMAESLYLFFVLWGLYLYVQRVAFVEGAAVRWALLVGLVFGLTSLTRGTALLFPLGLVGLLLWSAGRKHWRKGLLLALSLLLAYGMTLSTWTVYNLLRYERVVIASDQFFGALWRGAVEEDASPQENDELLGEQTPAEQAADVIAADPGGFVQRRFVELGQALLQPHGTLAFGGESLKALLQAWVQSGFRGDGLQQMLRSEAFLPKLLLYLWYIPALLLAPLGIWRSRGMWRLSLAPLGFIAYTLLLHWVVLALPRYLFPVYPLLWLFAAIGLWLLWDGLHRRFRRE